MVFVLMEYGNRASGGASREGRGGDALNMRLRAIKDMRYRLVWLFFVFRYQAILLFLRVPDIGLFACQVSGYPGGPSFSPFSSIFYVPFSICPMFSSFPMISAPSSYSILSAPSTSPKK